MNKIGFAIGFYIGAMIVTFGHAAANHECRQSVLASCEEQTVFSAAFAAVFQPLYWSWLAFDEATQ